VSARATLLLRDRADRRTLGLLAVAVAGYGSQWSSPRWWAVPLLGLLAFVACVAKHNHMHHPTFRRPAANVVFQHVLGLLTGTTATGILQPHNQRHHGANQSARDFVRCSIVSFRSNALNLLAFPFVAVWTMRREKDDELALWRRARPKLFRRALAERIALFSVVALVLAVDPRAALATFLLPWALGQFALVSINLVQHQDCDPTSDVDHSRDVVGRPLNWVLMNNGFHTAHHLRPSLHWSRLPALHAAEVEPRRRAPLTHDTLTGAIAARLLRPAPRAVEGAR
jgi:beta-carotene hydroxylase